LALRLPREHETGGAADSGTPRHIFDALTERIREIDGRVAGRLQRLKGKPMLTTDNVVTALRSRANIQDPYGERLMTEAARLIEDMAAEVRVCEDSTRAIEGLKAEVRRLEALVADLTASR
jgi:hypothetical protein